MKRRPCIVRDMWFSIVPWLFEIRDRTSAQPFDLYR